MVLVVCNPKQLVSPSMKALPKRKGNAVLAFFSLIMAYPLNESPSKKEGKLPQNLGGGGGQLKPSMKALPKRKGNPG